MLELTVVECQFAGVRTGKAKINGTELYFEVSGRGTPMVLIHGFSFDRRLWDPQVEVFAGQFELLRYDMRGYGNSNVPGTDTYRHSKDLAALLDHLNISRAHIAGLSLGGWVAVNFALEFPERCISVVAVDAAVEGFPRQKGSSAGRLTNIAVKSGVQAAKQHWLGPESLLGYSMRTPAVAHQVTAMVNEYSAWHFLHSDPHEVASPPAAARLAEITAPTLVIVGEHDQPEFHAMGEALHRGIPGAKKTVIRYAGHLPNLEQPQDFNHAVREFVNGVEPSPLD